MGKKSLLSTAVGIIGGIIFGYALGFQVSAKAFSQAISILIQEVSRQIGPQYAQLGKYIGEGVSRDTEEYIYQNVFNPIPFYAIGIIVIIVGLFIASKVGETSWLPWRRKKGEE